MSALFDSKVVLVTGGNSGIGQAIALAFAKEGAKVMVAARRVAEGKETVAIIKETGGEANFVQTDVTKTIEVALLALDSLKNQLLLRQERRQGATPCVA